MKHLALLLIRFYRKCISPIKPTCCRFTPTCSAYALEAFSDRGFLIGFSLTLRRMARCHPFGGCGYDPVPHGIKWKRIDLLRKKMERDGRPTAFGQGVLSVKTENLKSRRKVASLLPWESRGF